MLSVIGFVAMIAAVAGAIGYRWGRERSTVVTVDGTEPFIRDLREAGAKLEDVEICGVSHYGDAEYDVLKQVKVLVYTAKRAHHATPAPSAPDKQREEP